MASSVGNAGNRIDLLGHHLHFHDQMAQQLPGVGVIHRPVERKLVDLADVVEKAADQQQVDIDALRNFPTTLRISLSKESVCSKQTA